jgi:hypothetical protein
MIQWHWVSSAVCLVGMVLFSVTGITLNHASQIEARPGVEKFSGDLPPELLQKLNETRSDGATALPAEVADWLGGRIPRAVKGRSADWSADEVYLSMPGPGSDAWLSIDRETGLVEFEGTDRGWIAYLNDLHKGRNTGAAWKWFIDVFAVGTLVFCFTGLYLLYFHARHRAMTWPVVALGLIVPFLIAALLGLHS